MAATRIATAADAWTPGRLDAWTSKRRKRASTALQQWEEFLPTAAVTTARRTWLRVVKFPCRGC